MSSSYEVMVIVLSVVIPTLFLCFLCSLVLLWRRLMLAQLQKGGDNNWFNIIGYSLRGKVSSSDPGQTSCGPTALMTPGPSDGKEFDPRRGSLEERVFLLPV